MPLLEFMVGTGGFEPPTSALSRQRSPPELRACFLSWLRAIHSTEKIDSPSPRIQATFLGGKSMFLKAVNFNINDESVKENHADEVGSADYWT